MRACACQRSREHGAALLRRDSVVGFRGAISGAFLCTPARPACGAVAALAPLAYVRSLGRERVLTLARPTRNCGAPLRALVWARLEPVPSVQLGRYAHATHHHLGHQKPWCSGQHVGGRAFTDVCL
eukprot:COSAG01_NODE_155_length_23814_cov_12.061343_12_plen_126_part_00